MANAAIDLETFSDRELLAHVDLAIQNVLVGGQSYRLGKVDWWDSDYSLTEKRRTLQTSWQVHKTLGTKAAVEKAITAIFPNTTVEEWFAYGGDPYHFRLSIELGGERLDREKQARVLERVNFYKNLRSHLDGVSYTAKFETVPFENHRTAALCLQSAGFDFRFLNGILEDCATLSGERPLDGAWVLGQSLWGLAMEGVQISMAFSEPAGGSARPFVMDFGVQAQNPVRLGLSAACSIPVPERGHVEMPRTAIALGARNAFGFTAGQILDGEWLWEKLHWGLRHRLFRRVRRKLFRVQRQLFRPVRGVLRLRQRVRFRLFWLRGMLWQRHRRLQRLFQRLQKLYRL